jgi:hypothetical protein
MFEKAKGRDARKHRPKFFSNNFGWTLTKPGVLVKKDVASVVVQFD